MNYVDATGHAYDTSQWGYREVDGHARLCSVCNERDRVIEHKSSGTATEERAEICTVCEYVISSALEHTHSPAEEWAYNDTYHWKDCIANDGAELNKEAHSFSKWIVVKEASETEPGIKAKVCVCRYTETEEIPALKDATDAPSNPNEDHTNCEANGWVRFWNAIFNFFRRLFGLPEQCVCGKELS